MPFLPGPVPKPIPIPVPLPGSTSTYPGPVYERNSQSLWSLKVKGRFSKERGQVKSTEHFFDQPSLQANVCVDQISHFMILC